MGLDVEGNRLVPFLNDTHVFSTLVRFSVVALPLPLVMAFFLSFCFCGWSLLCSVLALLRLLCVWSPRCRAGLPVPLLLVGVFLCLAEGPRPKRTVN